MINNKIIYGVGTFTCALIVFFAVVEVIKYDRQQTQRSVERERKQFEKANTICGSPPIKVKPHGTSWSWGPYLEVTCSDNTKRFIRA
jgi:hypothetical protein